MKEAPIKEIIGKARQLGRQGRKWHFHMLGLRCKFNRLRGKFCIVLEDEESGETLYAAFEEKPLKEARELADLMYGRGFLEKEEKGGHSAGFDSILKRAKELTESGREWHHHHLHPDCIFNEHKGKHCIVFEDDETGESLEVAYEQEPMEDLVKIEKLFYRDLR
jgi:hypothetical protein